MVPFENLAPSAFVDFAHLVGCAKPAVRLQFFDSFGVSRLASWCGDFSFTLVVDNEGFGVIARSAILAATVLEVDRSLDAHEVELGRLLGYPSCCCRAAAVRGESRLDDLADEASRWPYPGAYRRIDPSGYCEGTSLICHVPCRPTCIASLRLACRALSLVARYPQHPKLRRWSSWISAV